MSPKVRSRGCAAAAEMLRIEALERATLAREATKRAAEEIKAEERERAKQKALGSRWLTWSVLPLVHRRLRT